MLEKIIAHLKSIPIKYILLVLFIIAIIYLAVWVMISKKLGNKTIDVIDTMRDNQINLTIDSYSNKGFPNSFTTLINNITYRNNSRAFAWKTKNITLHHLLFNPNIIKIDAPYDHSFFIRPDNKKKSVHHIAVRSNICQANVFFKNNTLQKIQLTSRNGMVQTSASKQIYGYDFFGFDMKMSQILLEDTLEDIIEMHLDIKNISPSQFWKTILEDNFLSLTANMYLRNPSYIRELPDFKRYIVRNYDQPELIIDKMTLIHPLSTLQLSGLLTFDSNMTLNGDIVVTLSNYQKLLAFLTKKGVLSTQAAKNFRFMLSLILSTKTLEKNDGSVDVAFRIKKNTVYHGKTRLFDISL
jgi:hypothetical protein